MVHWGSTWVDMSGHCGSILFDGLELDAVLHDLVRHQARTRVKRAKALTWQFKFLFIVIDKVK